MGFLTISTLSVLSKYAGILSCEDSPNCSAKTANSQRVLFYISIPFIIIGISGHMVSVPSFIDDQQEQRETKNDQDDVEGKKPGKFRRFFRKFALFWAVILLNLAFALISWPVQFGVPTIGMIVATLLFMSRSSSYKYVKPQGSPLTTISRVFVAAASKRHCLLPQDADKLHENPSTSDPLPHTQGLRFSLST
jgi:peptide/histidine transporter 3/4